MKLFTLREEHMKEDKIDKQIKSIEIRTLIKKASLSITSIFFGQIERQKQLSMLFY